MSFDLFEDAFGDHRNAMTLAKASELAYLDQENGKREFAAQLGLDAQLFSVGNTQAFLAQNDDHVIVAFRGTESPTSFEGLKDWLLSDAVNLLILPSGRLGTDFAAAGVGARFHQGFIDALGSIWEPLYSRVEAELKRADRPLWITGHSLGGALAVLSAWLFQRKFVNVHQVYTFGGPMIGNAEASKAFDKELARKIYRYVNGPDPVPKLPTISLIANDYGHVMSEVTSGVGPGASSSVELFGQFVSRSVDGVINGTLVDDVWKAVTQTVDAHLMPSYHRLIESLRNPSK
ncbi:lipase family protein [Schlesneria paludicola]|uniref:lipase family protein n=1 Tax=Schlesneria paludicola TaxID=360056 RepID=UPI00029ADA7A|nr:lipase family protein [Schlesneria paludicola]